MSKLTFGYLREMAIRLRKDLGKEAVDHSRFICTPKVAKKLGLIPKRKYVSKVRVVRQPTELQELDI